MAFLNRGAVGLALCVANSVVIDALGNVEEDLPFDGDDECAASTGEEREHCVFNALQLRGMKVQGTESLNLTENQRTYCAALWAPQNLQCKKAITWVVNGGGRNNQRASDWFKDMQLITGVNYQEATQDDFQRLYYCAPPGGKSCGAPPCDCTHPPCDTCLASQRDASQSQTCRENPGSIACKPPRTPMDYKGMTWPTIKVHGTKEQHIFAIGDWGGMDGTLNPIEGRPRLIAYSGGGKSGPSVFPRTRWDKGHKVELCSHKQFIACYGSSGTSPECPQSCGFVRGVDDQPQQLVASAMRERATRADPAVILNVGDNFYWGGIEKTCGTPMGEISFTAYHQFNNIFEQVYQGNGLSGKPWLSILGNHDWGGRQFNNGWDQQIAYTWASERWIMPAPYWMTTIDWVDLGFTADVILTDTNFLDAQYPSKDPEHNICGFAHNPPGATCYKAGGPMSTIECPSWFNRLWQEQKSWMTQKLSESNADWQIMVTHFPCGEDGENQAFYRRLHQEYGLDLLVTGHRHDQELWTPEMTFKNRMGGLTCFVTGGGGGISSEATPNPHNTKDWYGEGQYGFYDLTISKDSIFIESINYDGKVKLTTTVYPK